VRIPRRNRHHRPLPGRCVTSGGRRRHTKDTNTSSRIPAVSSQIALADLMTRMGHDSESAALIYQHQARGADMRITDAIDSHVQAERGQDDGATARQEHSSRRANCTLVARKAQRCPLPVRACARSNLLTLGFALERVTRIELALSAWEADVLPLNYTRARLQLSVVAVTGVSLRCVRPDIVSDPVGCQRAPLRS
jgi:hypothetical protein